MPKDLQTLFNQAKYYPAENLSEDIWHTIYILEERRARTYLWVYGCTGVFAFVALFPVIMDVSQQFMASGFYDYVSLFFSDTATIMSYPKEFFLSLADSVPATSVLISFSLVFLLLMSLTRMSRRLKNPFMIA